MLNFLKESADLQGQFILMIGHGIQPGFINVRVVCFDLVRYVRHVRHVRVSSSGDVSHWGDQR